MDYIVIRDGSYYGGAFDLDGNPVKKTKRDYPYSYDEHVIFKKGDVEQANHTVYSDRMLQWDYDKSRKLMQKHFGEQGDYYTNRSPSKIESYLKEYFDDNSIELIAIVEGCNYSNGYPYWIFFMKSNKY